VAVPSGSIKSKEFLDQLHKISDPWDQAVQWAIVHAVAPAGSSSVCLYLSLGPRVCQIRGLRRCVTM
jgi:hypothetical protein